MTPQERKVMELALEALEKLTNAAEGFSVSGVYFNEELWARKCLDDAYDAMGFAQEALSYLNGEAQPEQEPVAWLDPEGDDDCKVITASWKRKLQAMSTQLEQEHAAKHTVPVYTTPPQRKPEQVKWGIEWGHSGDRTCVSIVKKHEDGTLEVVATEYDTRISPAPQRKPLTDEQIEAQKADWFHPELNLKPETIFHRGIRAAEAAHGIKELSDE